MPTFSAIILAGGRASRMGGQDKGLLPLAGAPLISHAIRTLQTQVDDVVISANRNQEEYARMGCPVVSDRGGDYAGPLAGIHAALPHCTHEWVLVVACDCPLLPADLVARLYGGLHAGARLAVAHDGVQLQNLCLLLHRSLHSSLGIALAAGQAKVGDWISAQAQTVVTIADPHSFRNINTAEELAAIADELRWRGSA